MSRKVLAAGVEVQVACGKGPLAQVVCSLADLNLQEREVAVRYRGPALTASFRSCPLNMPFQVEAGALILVQTPRVNKAVACKVTCPSVDDWRVAKVAS